MRFGFSFGKRVLEPSVDTESEVAGSSNLPSVLFVTLTGLEGLDGFSGVLGEAGQVWQQQRQACVWPQPGRGR